MSALTLYWEAFKEARNDLKDRAECKAIAKAFNDRYCYRHPYAKNDEFFSHTFCRKGYRWMCPECNAIHAPTDHSVFSGLQYPSCCSTGEGHRLSQSDSIKTSR